MPNFPVARFFSQRPWLVSLILILLLTAWLGLGSLKAEESAAKNAKPTIPLAKVVYQTFTAEQTPKRIDLYGRTAPDREARIGAEIAGKIDKLIVRKGSSVKKGQLIASIDKSDLSIQLERAQAMLKVKEKEYKASQSLKKKGLQGEVAFANAEASLIEAKAMVSNVKVALDNTQVTAPFSGIVDHLFIEEGDFVGIGDPVATVIDLSRLVIEADVSERHIQKLTAKQPAKIRFIDGTVVEGTVRYISRVSSSSTNTFPLEIEIANPNQRIPAGISAEVELTLNEQLAVKVTPAMLALDAVGNLGVKTLENNIVRFVPIQLVKAEQDGVWLSGLGDEVDIITVGQGFVRDGDSVEAIEFSQHELALKEISQQPDTQQ
ncbi:efflux RND transporter periplasmic adaptor subunit [Vibrio genomosp. F10 str. 9ZC157]|uniref:Efflux transporter periplasmic adaptor subunit n=1 Tax=Vibrio genomosp. F10 str. ZF-129 TaxID=1187848 RepID=A0A1E5BEY7_9VIBR|nr:efflux RND transporter periplasmic adaptor subunit [Vibrio genomosp. F10]OEE34126.1 efflux transporter periplasmic adaptor subunit [Vibrio genomosp. F10 str. ZF-129]OEE93218.1 efflux transporter periplasmic adaptor subunit [Vibrio genomosp. F10 str. 9ZC157]